MMWKEFERIAGYEVSREDYDNYIEPMYMAVGDGVTKAEFVKMVNKERFALPTPAYLLRQVRKEARHLATICGITTDYKSEERMHQKAHEYMERKYGINWGNDSKAFCYFLTEYEYPTLKRGCTYPVTLVIGRDGTEFERVKLQKS